MIRFDSVSYSYRTARAAVPAVRSVTLEIEEGELVAVLGANGSGKSTLGLLANGLLMPDTGSVTVDGMDTRDGARSFDVRARVGMVFQNPDNQIVTTTVEEDVAFGPENLGLPREEIQTRVSEAIAACGLEGLERREPHLLSGGQKQRLAIAGALALRPRYLVLDEPASMLDATGRQEFASVLSGLKEARHGLLLITHDLSGIAAADRAVVLSQGALAYEGDVAGLLEAGSRLDEWGLALPSVALLASELRSRGLPVPARAVAPGEIVAALC